MAHIFELTDEQYARLEAAAHERGESPQDLFRSWLDSVAPVPQAAAQRDWGDVPPPTEEELREHPFLRVMGTLSVGIPGWADRHDEAFGGEESADDAVKP